MQEKRKEKLAPWWLEEKFKMYEKKNTLSLEKKSPVKQRERAREVRINRFNCLPVLLHRLLAHTDVENNHQQERSPIYGFDTFPKRNSPKQDKCHCFHGSKEKRHRSLGRCILYQACSVNATERTCSWRNYVLLLCESKYEEDAMAQYSIWRLTSNPCGSLSK